MGQGPFNKEEASINKEEASIYRVMARALLH